MTATVGPTGELCDLRIDPAADLDPIRIARRVLEAATLAANDARGRRLAAVSALLPEHLRGLVDAPEPGDPGHRHLVTAGGRVLAVRARGYDIEDARTRAYAAAGLISFDGMQRRSDIAAEPLGVTEGASVLDD